MTCRKARRMLVGLFDRDCAQTESEVRSHLAVCSNCARQYTAMQAVVSFIRPRFRIEASPGFRERVLNALIRSAL